MPVEWVESIQRPESGDFRIWRFGGRPTTLIHGDRHVKTTHGYYGDEDLARACHDEWKRRDYGGVPSGPAAFFHQEVETPRVPWTVNGELAKHFHGGWMEAMETGYVPGPLGLYDIRSAYTWAGSLPLPGKLRPYTPGDNRFVVVFRRTGGAGFLPRYFQRRTVVATHEDVETYDLSGDPLWGVSWRADDEHTEVADLLAKDWGLPTRAEKLLRQSYWGRWACRTRTVQETYHGGNLSSDHELKSRTMHIPWATIIVHRVMRRVYRAALAHTVLVCVDAVLRSRPLPADLVGDRPGLFRLKEMIGREGVQVRAPGIWSKAPAPTNVSRWDRHAGVPAGGSGPRRARLLPERKAAALMERTGETTVAGVRKVLRQVGRSLKGASLPADEVFAAETRSERRKRRAREGEVDWLFSPQRLRR